MVKIKTISPAKIVGLTMLRMMVEVNVVVLILFEKWLRCLL